MVIALDEKSHQIAFIFYDTQNFYELQRVRVKRYQFDCAMIVNEISSEVQENKESFVVALFKVQMDEEICSVVKIIKDKNKWRAEESNEISTTENQALSKLMNAYQTQLDEVVCVTQYRSIVFNSQL